MTQDFSLSPVGRIHSCFTDRFGVPRQPGLCPHARGWIELLPPWDTPDALRGLEGFSHLWLTFIFHQTREADASRALIRPPRLGGNQRVGVFASRSPFRPNRLGLSLVQHHGLKQTPQGLFLEISGLDLTQDTPVLDIKPYLPWCDSAPDASADWAQSPPEAELAVRYCEQALAQLHQHSTTHPELDALIREVLSQDPRPGYQRHHEQSRIHGMHLFNLNIRWQVQDGYCLILSISAQCE